MTISPTINKYFNDTTFWESTEGGFKIYGSWERKTPIDMVSDSDLAQVHPHLPIGVRIMQRRNAFIMGMQIKTLLSVLTSPCIVRSKDDEEVMLKRVKDIKVTREYVQFFASGYILSRTPTPLSDAGFIYTFGNSANKRTLVTAQWMNNAFPGWRERMQVAQVLCDDIEYAVEAIFQTKTATHQVAVPEDFTCN